MTQDQIHPGTGVTSDLACPLCGGNGFYWIDTRSTALLGPDGWEDNCNTTNEYGDDSETRCDQCGYTAKNRTFKIPDEA